MAGNSLGVLTLDLVARIGGFVEPLHQAEQASTTSFGKMRDGMNKYGAAVGAGALAVGAALGVMTAETVNNANEIAKLSAIAGTSTDDFQRMAAGAKAFGFEQDALADILKDSQEKMGEFTAAGGGGAIDFFEQIAPKVGVTAKMFENLSGADGLQLYVSTLEKAGVGSNEMVFYMEALASESSKLLPLLKNGGAAVKLFGDAAENAGAIIDKKTIAKANELKGVLYLLDLQVDGIKNNIASNLVPTLLDLSQAFSAPTKNGDSLIDWATHFDGALRGIGAVVLSVIGSLHTLGKLALVIPSSLGPAFTAQDKPLAKIWQNMKDGFRDVVDTNNEYGNRADDLLEGNQSRGDAAKMGEALNQAEEDRKIKASAEAGAKMLADKQAAYDKFAMLNASEVENVKYKYAQMRKEIAANTNFSVDQRSKASSAVNVAEAKELSTIKKRVADESQAKAQAMMLAQDQKKQELAAYALMNASELDQIKGKYAAERNEIMKKSGWSIAEKKRVIDEINKAEQKEIDDANESRKISLLAFADMNKTELQLLKDKYSSMREEVAKNKNYTRSEREAALAEIAMAEQRDKRAANMSIRTKYDDLLRIEVDYQAELKRIRDSGLTDDEKLKYEAQAEVVYDKAVDAEQKPFTEIKDRLGGDMEDDSFDKLKEKYDLERELVLKYTEDNENARQELLSQLQSEYHNAQMMTTLSYGSDIAGNMASILKDMGQEQSKAYKVMFAVSKAFAIADAGLNILKGIAAASSLVFPANLAAMASVAAATAGLVGNIQSIKMVGQAHDGIMSVPESGTWNLQRGERVLPQDTAQQLDQTLATIGASKSPQSINVNIENYGSSKAFEVQQIDTSTVRIIARDEVARGAGRAVAADMANPNSDASKSMQRNLMVERRR